MPSLHKILGRPVFPHHVKFNQSWHLLLGRKSRSLSDMVCSTPEHLKQALDLSFQAQFPGMHPCSKTTFTLDQTHPNGAKWPSIQNKVQVWKHPKADGFSQTFQIMFSYPRILQDSIHLHCNSSSLVENDAASDQWAGPNEKPSQTYHLGSHHP